MLAVEDLHTRYGAVRAVRSRESGSKPLAHHADHRGVRGTADLYLVCELTGHCRGGRPPRADQQRRQRRRQRVAQPGAGGEPEYCAVHPLAVALKQGANHLDRLAQMGDRAVLAQPDRGEPGASGQAKVGTSAGCLLERGHLPGDLVGMHRVGVPARRAEPDARRDPRHLQQRIYRRLKEQVAIHAEDIEPVILSQDRECRVLAGALVGLEAQPDLDGRGQVRSASSAGRRRSGRCA